MGSKIKAMKVPADRSFHEGSVRGKAYDLLAKEGPLPTEEFMTKLQKRHRLTRAQARGVVAKMAATDLARVS